MNELLVIAQTCVATKITCVDQILYYVMLLTHMSQDVAYFEGTNKVLILAVHRNQANTVYCKLFEVESFAVAELNYNSLENILIFPFAIYLHVLIFCIFKFTMTS